MSITTGLELIASELERPGFVTFGVMYNGAFHPLGLHKLGHGESFAGSPTSLAVNAPPPDEPTEPASK